MERANDQAGDRDPAAKNGQAPQPQGGCVGRGGRGTGQGKGRGGRSDVDRDKAAALAAVAVKTVEIKFMQNCDLSSLDQ
jgi:hypothetical protein